MFLWDEWSSFQNSWVSNIIRFLSVSLPSPLWLSVLCYILCIKDGYLLLISNIRYHQWVATMGVSLQKRWLLYWSLIRVAVVLWSLTWVFGLFCLLFVCCWGLSSYKWNACDFLRRKGLESEKCRFGHLKLKGTNLEKTEIWGARRGPLQVGLLIKIISSLTCPILVLWPCLIEWFLTLSVHHLELMFLDSCDHNAIHVRRRNSSKTGKVEMNSFYEILNMLAFEGDPASLL